ncbi:hypothetical protein HWV62_45547 [Athelia sp. TMB]|nr:hypothetical protein HWV62_45547 [Athelia sp. TMB]
MPNTPTPADISAEALNLANSKQLKFWISRANENLGNDRSAKKMVKSGKVEDLKARLAEHYGINRAAVKLEAVAGPPIVDADIQKRQWADFRELWAEWMDSAAKGDKFVLDGLNKGPSDSQQQEIERMLSHLSINSNIPVIRDTPMTDFSHEAIAVLINAARDGHPSARDGHPSAWAQLQQIRSTFIQQPTLMAPAGPIIPLPSSSTPNNPLPAGTAPPFFPGGVPMYSPFMLAPLYPTTAPSTSNASASLPLSTSAVPSSNPISQDADFLSSIQEQIRSLRQVTDIREAIQQCKSGLVADLRNNYGPSIVNGKRTGRSHPLWDSVKNIVSRRERLYAQLKQHFDDDEEKFYGFFTVPSSECSRSSKNAAPALRSMNCLVNSISKMEDALASERQKASYCTADGNFSTVLWKSVWDDKNDWEVWRALGKEEYSK